MHRWAVAAGQLGTQAIEVPGGIHVEPDRQARDVKPLGFNGYDPQAFRPGAPEAGARASIAALAEFNRHGAKTHSGVWRDLAVRKRKTEVDMQIGLIAELGREAGVETPAIRKLVELVHAVEDGTKPMARETLMELVEVAQAAPPLPA